jgi:hypothetical protein
MVHGSVDQVRGTRLRKSISYKVCTRYDLAFGILLILVDEVYYLAYYGMSFGRIHKLRFGYYLCTIICWLEHVSLSHSKNHFLHYRLQSMVFISFVANTVDCYWLSLFSNSSDYFK